MTSNTMQVVSVNISPTPGTAKRPVARAVLDEWGVRGDAHAGRWHRQVSLLSEESMRRFAQARGIEIGPGDFGENLTVRGLPAGEVRLLDRFRINETELEVTQIGKSCHGEGCAIFQRVGKCIMPREGLFARVLAGGVVKPGDALAFFPKVWRFRAITLSDRAFAGEYEDRSGPRLRELLCDFLKDTGWRFAVDSLLLSDAPEPFREALQAAREAQIDAVFVTGGTGVGPRDFAPETVAAFCDRLIPGLPEAIRARYGATNPNALLSRAVVGLAGTTVVYTMPGSVRAVEEYMAEILRTLEHLLLTVHGLEVH